MSRFFRSFGRAFQASRAAPRFQIPSGFPQRAATFTLATAGATSLLCTSLIADTKPTTVDWTALGEDIEELIESQSDYDDGSFGPLLVRLAWHSAGTFSTYENNGGSYGATMRHKLESSDGANNGLAIARDLLEPLIAKYPGLSHGDLWTYAAVVAIKYMGGPDIPWYSGRKNLDDEYFVPPNGRLPQATGGPQHIRSLFERLELSLKDGVALCGAHALGRCHADRSGYVGPWTRSPTTFSNEYYKLLLSEDWVEGQPGTAADDPTAAGTSGGTGPRQYTDKATRTLMMLPADIALLKDPAMAVWVKKFASSEAVFFDAFAEAYGKLLANGVPRS